MASLFEELFQRRATKIKLGLGAIQLAYGFLPQKINHATNILIGGTNGKGSTAGFLFHLLTQNPEIRVGLYSSPHLIHFSERIWLSQKPMSDTELFAQFSELKTHVPDDVLDSLSFFEIATLLGFYVFASQQNHINIFEVGLGGRLDATNVIDPDFSAIVSISRDHEDLLGGDLKSIALEKLGICRAGKDLYFGSGGELGNQPKLLAEVLSIALDKGVQLRLMGKAFGITELGFRLTDYHGHPHDFAIPEYIKGAPRYLQSNFSMAAAIYFRIQEKKPQLELSALSQCEQPSFSSRIPPTFFGRCEQRQVIHGAHQYPVILDVCHNPDGARQFARSLPCLYRPQWPEKLPGMVCIFQDKAINGILDILKEILHPIVLFHIGSPRDFRKSDLEARHSEIPIYQTFAIAWENGKKNDSFPTVVCGSVMAVGHVMEFFTPEQGVTGLRASREHWLFRGWLQTEKGGENG